LIQTLLILTAIMLPIILLAYPSNPPVGLTGAPGESTCVGCHSPITTGSGVTVTFPNNALTYTPGGPAIPLTVAVTGSGGFELSTRVQNDNSQAGTLAAGTGSAVSSSSGIQYIYQSGPAASWTFNWTPPATNVGNVVVYVTGVTSQTFANSYTLTPASSTPSETLSVSSSSLAFTYDGTPTATQTVQVTSSGAALPFTTSVSTTSGGNWLTAVPAAGNTPMGVTVSALADGLAVGTYTGTITVASTGATNSPLTINVSFDVTVAGPQPLPTLAATPATLAFTADANTSTVAPQNLQVATSDGSAVSVAAAAATASGGNWLAVSPATGSTPLTLAVTADPTGLANGTYHGTITLAAMGASNNPLSVPVTLTVGPSTPPTAGPLYFRFNVVDSQSGGSNNVLLEGRGSIDSAGKLTGGGSYTQFSTASSSGGSTGGDDARTFRRHHTVSTGYWTATGVTSFTPAASGASGGVLEITVSILPRGGTAMTGTMRIANTGTDKGVKLTIDGGATFMPTGTGRVSIVTGSSSGSGGGGDDNEPGEGPEGGRSGE